MTNEKKFNELLENKDFMQEIISMETLEEVQGGFAEQGVEVSKDEVEQLGEVIKEVNEKISKLSDDELNLIVGGNSGGNEIFICSSSSSDPIGVVKDEEMAPNVYKSIVTNGPITERSSVTIANNVSSRKGLNSWCFSCSSGRNWSRYICMVEKEAPLINN